MGQSLERQSSEQRVRAKAKARTRSLPTHITSKRKKASLAKEKAKAKVRESLTKEKGKLTNPSLQLQKAKGNSNSFPKANNGAASASKRGILHKLAGGIRILTSSSFSTRKEQLGRQKASNNLHKLGPATTLASANFFSVAWWNSSCAMAWRTSASALQHEPTSHLHQLATRQPIHVELGTTVTSFDPSGAFSTCLYHSYAEEKLPAFQQSFEDMGHLG